MQSRSYEDLIVWQKSIQLVVLTYECTESFPKTEQFGLTSQMRRASVSIASNIAEGSKRGGEKEFLRIAYGSASELETQLHISQRLVFCPESHYQGMRGLITEVSKMLHALCSTFELKTPHTFMISSSFLAAFSAIRAFASSTAFWRYSMQVSRTSSSFSCFMTSWAA